MKTKHKYDLYSVVELAKDLPSERLKTGALGTIVLVHQAPETAYEVEFSDPDGRTIAEIALTESEIRPHVS